MNPLLSIVNLSKSFGPLRALQNITLDVYPGEVVGVAGRSGAGKSVLAAIIAGLLPPNEGELYFAGQPLTWPFQARDLQIGVIHQEPSLADNLDITSNIFLGNETGWSIFGSLIRVLNRRQMGQQAHYLLHQLDVQFPTLSQPVATLSSEQRQLIAIGQVMARPTQLIVIDEPTVLLSFAKQKLLLSLIQTWQKQGTTIIFGSTNLEHLFAVTDRIITLRQGKQITEHQTDETSREEVVAALMGTTNQQQLTPAIWALDNYYQARQQAENLQQQQALLERDLAAQGTLNRQLVNQLAEQVKALDQTNLALQAAQRRLLTEREQERKHLSRELHDQVIQDLLSVNYQLEDMESSASVTPEMTEEFAAVRNTIRQLVEDVRGICGDLRPPTIDSFGLEAAIQSYTQEWSERTGIPIALDLDLQLGRLLEATELSIFRIVQESLSNINKHAQASHVEISLKHTSPRMLMISISDNGQGIDETFDLSQLPVQGHYGLLGISERVALLGGRLKLQNNRSGGLLLQVEIPHPRPKLR